MFNSAAWTTACQAPLCFIVSLNFVKLMSIESVMPSNHFILCRPFRLPSIFPSIRVFSNELALCIRWPEYWSFSFSISPSNVFTGLILFRIDWFDLLAVILQGILKSFSPLSPAPQFKSILSLLYGPTLTSIHDCWKKHSFDYMKIFSKVMSLHFNMLSRLAIAFLPRSKRLLISWIQSPSEVILEHMKIKSVKEGAKMVED